MLPLRLFGDLDASDYATFGNAFGATVIGSPFDFDNNIDASDFAQFGIAL